MGFASLYPTNLTGPLLSRPSSRAASPRAQAKSSSNGCDKTTRRANRQNLSSPPCKNILIFRSGKSVYSLVPSCSARGALAIVTDVGRDAVDAKRATDERALGGRRSRVVLAPRRWRQVDGNKFPAAMVARKPGHQGERGVSCKPSRREGRIASAEPVCSCAFLFVHFAHETAGAARTRSSLRPLCFRGQRSLAKPGRIVPRQCGRAARCCLTVESEVSPSRRPGQVSASERQSGTHTALCHRMKR